MPTDDKVIEGLKGFINKSKEELEEFKNKVP